MVSLHYHYSLHLCCIMYSLTYIFSLSLPSTVSVACKSLKRSLSSRSGKSLRGVLEIWTLESALDCSAKFPRDTIRGLQSANTLVHTLWLFSRLWKLFLSAWLSESTAGLDILDMHSPQSQSGVWAINGFFYLNYFNPFWSNTYP